MTATVAVDPSAQAFTRAGVYRRGVPVTFQRLSGVAPNAFSFSAENIIAAIGAVTPDSQEPAQTGIGAGSPGAITQNDRLAIVMACDLAAARFPLPLKKGDVMIVLTTGDQLTVTRVDPDKRALAGAIEVYVTGVA